MEMMRNDDNLSIDMAIEPKIKHLKSDYRMNINFLKGVIGDEMKHITISCCHEF